MKSVSINFGGLTLLTILFVCLKLAHVIDWSWWIVFLPSLIGICATVLFLLCVGFVWIICYYLTRK